MISLLLIDKHQGFWIIGQFIKVRESLLSWLRWRSDAVTITESHAGNRSGAAVCRVKTQHFVDPSVRSSVDFVWFVFGGPSPLSLCKDGRQWTCEREQLQTVMQFMLLCWLLHWILFSVNARSFFINNCEATPCASDATPLREASLFTPRQRSQQCFLTSALLPLSVVNSSPWIFKLRLVAFFFPSLNESRSVADMKPLYSLKRHLFLVSMPPLKVNSSFQ